MPTGYTADIKDGISFETFIMNCARAFGACFELRDEGGGGERIPDSFAPNGFHAKELETARVELAALEAMTPAELERNAAKAYDDAETTRVMALRDKAAQREAYEAMLEKVRMWTPPTEEHKSLHSFMADQILESIRFDCGSTYYETPTMRVTGAEWAAGRRAALTRDVERHAREYAADVKRAADRTAWVKALRDSIEKGT